MFTPPAHRPDLPTEPCHPTHNAPQRSENWLAGKWLLLHCCQISRPVGSPTGHIAWPRAIHWVCWGSILAFRAGGRGDSIGLIAMCGAPLQCAGLRGAAWDQSWHVSPAPGPEPSMQSQTKVPCNQAGAVQAQSQYVGSNPGTHAWAGVLRGQIPMRRAEQGQVRPNPSMQGPWGQMFEHLYVEYINFQSSLQGTDSMLLGPDPVPAFGCLSGLRCLNAILFHPARDAENP